MEVACPQAIPAELDVGFDHGAGEIGARRGLHLQHDVKALTGKRPPQSVVAAPAAFLVDGNEINAVQRRQQFVLQRRTYPGDSRLRPLLLNRAHHRHCVGYIAECGQPDDTDTIRG